VTVFVDTSALLALIDDADERHDAADQAFRFLLHGERLVTHNYVVVEAVSLVQRRLGAPAARDLVDRLLPLVRTIWVDESSHEAAVAALVASGSKRISLVDWTSFAIMRRERIDDAFTFDADFVAQGFRVVPPPQDPGAAIST
jgi:predicted nucleic acid-binding protein